MRASIINRAFEIYAYLFGRKLFYPFNRLLFILGAKGIGCLNYRNSILSGEKKFLKILSRVCPKGAVCIDIGAHMGEYSELLKTNIPQASLYSFEPNPRSFKSLKEKSASHNFMAIQAACGEKNEDVLMFDYSESKGSQHASLIKEVFEEIHNSEPMTIPVRVMTLDSFAEEEGLQRVFFLKVDTEGKELSVLRGAKRLIEAGSVDVIQFEFDRMNVFSRSFFQDFLKILKGYRFYRLVIDGMVPIPTNNPLFSEIFAFQNIVAIREELIEDLGVW